MDEVACIGLDIDRLVGRLRLSEAVEHHPGGAVVRVEGDIPEAAPVRGPHRLAGRRLDEVGGILARGEVAHPDRVQLGALGVRPPGQQPVIVRVGGRGDLEERQSLTLPVPVDEDGFLAFAAERRLRTRRPAADEGVLPSVPVAGVVGEGTVRLGDAAVVLTDPAPHLPDEALALVRCAG
ncbi:hypothetical protein KHHGKMAE_4213 [Methylobacterium persicinum]|nr:hypothetical protein KHHGKMAE_4213 [Methylobacterium persicinum]